MALKNLAMLLMAPALLAAGTASAATPPGPQGREASIPFVDTGSINDWRADGTHGLYVQDLRKQWYHADLIGPCLDLPYVETIGFETRGINSLDRFASVIVRGQRCAFSSFVTSDGPPKKAKKPHKG